MSVPDPIHWSFPLPRTHTGLLLGNGLQGLMIWGSHSLNITFGRAGFWDHRGGNAFTSRTTYDEVRRLLEADDHATLRTLFQLPGDSGSPNPSTQRPDRPRQLGGGRLELHFDQGYIPVQGTLHPGDGHAEILLRAPSQQEALVTIYQARGQEVAWISLPGSLRATVRLVPAWDHVHAELEPIGIQPPHRWQSADGGGFEQTLPEDDPLALAWHRDGATLVVATALGPGAAARAAESAATAPLPRLATESATWWRAYWDEMPTLSLPDPVLQEAWAYGAFKQAGLTAPCDVAATLQGPWMEEYQIPPWSNDYHFNINVEMIYWPALATGRWSHFEPLWRMIHRWMPELRANGQAFFKNPGALMLPHAVDDRCAAVGAFWTGMIDHACSAWMAQMAWLHYRYSLDETVLRETAWPLLVGAFEGYWSMLEDDGEALRLPVSVSPEFKGARTDAWGRNASFQLAACHMLASILPRAAALLGHPLDPRWSEVATRLPAYATVTTSRQKEYPEGQATRIALWKAWTSSKATATTATSAASVPSPPSIPGIPATGKSSGKASSTGSAPAPGPGAVGASPGPPSSARAWAGRTVPSPGSTGGTRSSPTRDAARSTTPTTPATPRFSRPVRTPPPLPTTPTCRPPTGKSCRPMRAWAW